MSVLSTTSILRVSQGVGGPIQPVHHSLDHLCHHTGAWIRLLVLHLGHTYWESLVRSWCAGSPLAAPSLPGPQATLSSHSLTCHQNGISMEFLKHSLSTTALVQLWSWDVRHGLKSPPSPSCVVCSTRGHCCTSPWVGSTQSTQQVLN